MAVLMTGRMWLQHVEQKWGIQDNYKFPKSSCIELYRHWASPVTSEIKSGLRTEPDKKNIIVNDLDIKSGIIINGKNRTCIIKIIVT